MTRFLMGPVSPERQSDFCMADTRNPGPSTHYLSHPWPMWSCKLERGHEGRHNENVNWIGHPETSRGFRGMTLEIRNQHGWGSAKFTSDEQIEAFCEWLKAEWAASKPVTA